MIRRFYEGRWSWMKSMWLGRTVDSGSVNLYRKLDGQASIYGEAYDWEPIMYPVNVRRRRNYV